MCLLFWWVLKPAAAVHTYTLVFLFSLSTYSSSSSVPLLHQCGAADAEINLPSGENTELKRAAFKAWNRSVYSHTCYAYWHGFLPYLFLSFRSIYVLFFFQNLSRFFPVLAVANTGSCVGPQNKIGHPAGCRVPVLSARGIQIDSKINYVLLFFWFWVPKGG